MITRACISINHACNLNCAYCHFHEKRNAIVNADMDVIQILDNIRTHIQKYSIKTFKLGFVGDGEPLLAFGKLQQYITHIADLLKTGQIAAYVITNGTTVNRSMIEFLTQHNVSIGFSIDGPKYIHDTWRCGSFDQVMHNIELYREITGAYPSMNCTVGEAALQNTDDIIEFFKPFNNKITFSRMIGKYGITLEEFHVFLDKVATELNVRRGGYDCTMYGGMCGAGIDNIFYANNKIFVCGNCIDVDMSFPANTPLDCINFNVSSFDRTNCYKESVLNK